MHIGAVALIHRFCFSLNGPVHFHVCLVDGVFEAVSGHIQASDVTDATPLFWCAETQFSTQGRMPAFAEPVQPGYGSGRASHHRRGRAGSGAAGQCRTTHSNICCTQSPTCT
ncbi:MAG: transposase, partial [Polaromonas sp.]|nr:transposase [Polaromonas sp.]